MEAKTLKCVKKSDKANGNDANEATMLRCNEIRAVAGFGLALTGSH